MRISDWSSDVCSSDLGQPGLSQRVAGFGEAVLAEVEDGSGKHRAGVTFAHALHKVLDVADAARCDDGTSDAVGDGAGERPVIAVAGAVPVHRGEQDFTPAQAGEANGMFDRVNARGAAAAVGGRKSTRVNS